MRRVGVPLRKMVVSVGVGSGLDTGSVYSSFSGSGGRPHPDGT